MNGYKEKEIKVLNIDVQRTISHLEKIGAKEVFSGKRIISTFDFSDRRCLRNDILIRLTEEENVKLTAHINNSSVDDRQIVKIHINENSSICKDFLSVVGLSEYTRLESYRTSYELGNVDFDLDQFPFIPPFLEIDVEFLDFPLDNLLDMLDLKNNRIVKCGTENIYQIYGIDYFSTFKL